MRAGRLVVALALGVTLTTAVVATASDLGKPAPSFTAAELDGRAIMLNDFKDKKSVVLVFYVGHRCGSTWPGSGKPAPR